MEKRIPDKQRIFIGATVIIVFIVAVFFLYLLNGFLSYGARLQHTEDGVGLNALVIDVLQYADDHNGTLPPMKDVTAFKSAVMPYAAGLDAAFHTSEDSKILFLPNPNLSLQKMSTVKSLTVFLYESAPSKADGSRWVACLPANAVPSPNGDPDFAGLKQVKEADWQRLKAANGIP